MKIFEYYKDLIAFRLKHPALRMTTAAEVIANLDSVYTDTTGIMAYQLTRGQTDDAFEEMLVIHNANRKTAKLKLPTGGGWVLVGNQDGLSDETIRTYEGGARISVAANSSFVLYRDTNIGDYNPTPMIVAITVGSSAAITGGVFLTLYIIKKKKAILV
jgi:pullulanase/glycogen debranching enzyme